MNSIIAILTGIAAIVGALGIAYAVFTSARVKTTIELYQTENEAQGKRIKSLEDDSRIKAEQIGSLKRENDTLRDLATGRSAVEALAASLTAEQALRREEHNAMMVLLGEMKESLSEVWRSVADFIGKNPR